MSETKHFLLKQITKSEIITPRSTYSTQKSEDVGIDYSNLINNEGDYSHIKKIHADGKIDEIFSNQIKQFSDWFTNTYVPVCNLLDIKNHSKIETLQAKLDSFLNAKNRQLISVVENDNVVEKSISKFKNIYYPTDFVNKIKEIEGKNALERSIQKVNNYLRCLICCYVFNSNDESSLTQHILSKKHQDGLINSELRNDLLLYHDTWDNCETYEQYIQQKYVFMEKGEFLCTVCSLSTYAHNMLSHVIGNKHINKAKNVLQANGTLNRSQDSNTVVENNKPSQMLYYPAEFVKRVQEIEGKNAFERSMQKINNCIRCLLCSFVLNVNNASLLNKHILGSNHQNNLLDTKLRNNLLLYHKTWDIHATYEEYVQQKYVFMEGDNFLCTICALSSNANEILTHVNSKKHYSKVVRRESFKLSDLNLMNDDSDNPHVFTADKFTNIFYPPNFIRKIKVMEGENAFLRSMQKTETCIRCLLCSCVLVLDDDSLLTNHILSKQHQDHLKSYKSRDNLLLYHYVWDNCTKYEHYIQQKYVFIQDGKFLCTICSSFSSSALDILQHINGNKHQAKLKKDENVSCSSLNSNVNVVLDNSPNSVVVEKNESLNEPVQSLNKINLYYPPDFLKQIRELEGENSCERSMQKTDSYIRCLLCSVILSDSSLAQHVLGAEHRNNLMNTKLRNNLQLYHVVWDNCEKPEQYVQQKYVFIKDYKFVCTVCTSSCNSPLDILCHVIGKKHYSKLKSKESVENISHSSSQSDTRSSSGSSNSKVADSNKTLLNQNVSNTSTTLDVMSSASNDHSIGKSKTKDIILKYITPLSPIQYIKDELMLEKTIAVSTIQLIAEDMYRCLICQEYFITDLKVHLNINEHQRIFEAKEIIKVQNYHSIWKSITVVNQLQQIYFFPPRSGEDTDVICSLCCNIRVGNIKSLEVHCNKHFLKMKEGGLPIWVKHLKIPNVFHIVFNELLSDIEE